MLNGPDDLFPSTAEPQSHIEEQSTYTHQLEPARDPLFIPLPPSPTSGKSSLPSRRPKEWATSTPELDVSETSTTTSSAQKQYRHQSPGARLVSGQRAVSISGRRVSGAMQYPLVPSTQSTTAGHEEGDAPVEDRSIAELDENEALEQVERDQQQDEVWMSHIRDQLSTLFPDFFDPDSELGGGAGEESELEQEEMVNLGLASRSTSGVTSASTASSWGVMTPMTASMGLSGLNLGRGGSGGSGGLRGVPSVREEIGGLREEIERLRGVVGGLAEDLGRGRAENAAIESAVQSATGDPAGEVGTVEVAGEAGGADEDEAGGAQDDTEGAELEEVERFVTGEPLDIPRDINDLPEAFLRNAPSIIKLLRALDKIFHKAELRKDDDVFDALNLSQIEDEVRSRVI